MIASPSTPLVDALERVATMLDTEPRARSRDEAPVELTTAYAHWILANGFARLDRPERARTYADRANAALAAHADDLVHGFLTAAFAARLDDALAGRPRDLALPDEVLAKLPAAPEEDARTTRYKIDRLREASPTLASDLPGDADVLAAFSRARPLEVRDPHLAALRAIADPAARAEHVARVLERGAAAEPALVERCLAVLLETDEAVALPVLAGAVPTLARTQGAPVLARALWAIAWFGYAELAPALLRPI